MVEVMVLCEGCWRLGLRMKWRCMVVAENGEGGEEA